MPQGFALEEAGSIDVVTAYATGQDTIPAVASTPGWEVIGEFYLGRNVSAFLEAILCVSDASLTANVRLFDLEAGVPVSGTVASSQSTTPVRATSGRVDLLGQRTYQIQAECVGGAGDDLFAVVETATISD